MDSVCPSSIYTGSSSPFVSTVGTTSTLLKDRDTADPSLNSVPSYTASLKTTKPRITLTASKSYDVSPFSVTSIIQEANTTLGSRYIPIDGSLNAPVPKLTSSQLENTYSAFTTKNVTGSNPTRLMIIPASTLQARNLTGNVTDATESVSYDLLYSLQYEFCFYSKYFSVLLADYIFIQNKTTDGFTDARKTALIQKIVNNLTVVKARLTDITDVAATIGTKQTGELKGMNDTINAFIRTTKESVDTLNANAAILMSKDKESNLRSRQLSYSEEKNAYANQLLAMYGFANLIALGLLFYIYKS